MVGKFVMKAAFTLLTVLLLSASAPAFAEDAQPEDHPIHGVNNGQDPTRPLTRLDIRYQYQNLAPSENDNANIVTLRADKPFVLGDGWSVATRFDMPLFFTDALSADNADGNTEFGMSDLLAQALVIKTASDKTAYAVGGQVILDTATEQEMGGGKYRLVPTLGMRYALPEISKGTWFAAVVRYDYDFADGSDEDDLRGHKSELQLSPLLNIALPDSWFIDLFPNTDIRYNFGHKKPGDDGRWFVPFDFMVGKMVTKSTVVSVEASMPMIDDYHVNDFKVEGRVGFFF